MTQHEDELEQVLRPWLHRHAPDAPNTFILRMIGEIETMSERAPTSGFLSRFAAWPASAWAAALTAIAILAAAGGILFVNLTSAPAVGTNPTPTPVPSPSTNADAAIVNGLLNAWNHGDPQDAVSRYVQSSPIVRFMIDSGDFTKTPLTTAEIQAMVVAWSADDAVMTRTGPVVRQGPFVAFPMTWTSTTMGTGDAVGLLRIDPETGLVVEHYFIGATALHPASAAPAPGDVVTLVDDELAAENAGDGSAGSALFAENADMRWYRNAAQAGWANGREEIAAQIGQGTDGFVWSRTGQAYQQGPLVFYPTTVIGPSGQGDEGFMVLSLNTDGLLQHKWAIGAVNNNLPGSPAPSAGGG
jgi:hypothetical protein